MPTAAGNELHKSVEERHGRHHACGIAGAIRVAQPVARILPSLARSAGTRWALARSST